MTGTEKFEKYGTFFGCVRLSKYNGKIREGLKCVVYWLWF